MHVAHKPTIHVSRITKNITFKAKISDQLVGM